MNKILFSIIILFLNFILGNTFQICGTEATNVDIIHSIQYYNEYKGQQYNSNRNIHWIPIQFHIVKQSDGSGGLNEVIFPGIIDDLNMDYINANIRFYQFGELDYILDSEYYSTDGDIEINELKSINNIDNVIDIYAVANLSSDSGQLCGISSFTWFGIQGIVVANSCFDRYTINHEVGHYFDLFHPHEDANGLEYVNGSGCSFRGDGICDTPADPNLSLGGMVNACNYTGAVTDSNGQEYDDCQGYEVCELYGGPDVGNIMSYAPDNCVNHFTDEQYEKVEFILLNQRPNYIMSPNYVEYNVEVHNITEINGDNDLVINPGEEIDLVLNINIDESWPVGANELILTLNTEEQDVNIVFDQMYLPVLNTGESFINELEPFQIQFNINAEIKNYDFNLNITYVSENGNYNEANFDIELNVSLNQYGFPFETNSTVKSSPAIIDLDGDGDNEIIFGSHNGVLYICETSMNDCSEFVSDGQIWGSPAVADIDNDGNLEIVFASVDKYIYVLNHLGEFEYSFYTDQFLVGTPAIGNLDFDAELEIVIGGFTSSSNLFVFNHDLTYINQFPIDINEKIKEGVALVDVDGDGLDEVFFGTESENLYRVNHEGILFNNVPLYQANDKIVFSPVIIEFQGEYLIGFGSDGGNFYLINSDGELVFTYMTGNKIRSSASVIETNNIVYIIFGSEDGFIYLIDLYGNNKPGWPIYIGEPIENTPVFCDLQNDGDPEVLVVGSNSISIYSMSGEAFIEPIEYNYSITGSPVINDFDLDGDLEIIVGTNYDLTGIDIKMQGNTNNHWSMFRENLKRTGFLDYSTLGSLDAIINSNFDLIQPYPNPFNSTINLPIQIDNAGAYSLNIYNIKGESIFQRKIYYDIIGEKQLKIDFNGNSSGTYFIQFGSNKSIKTSKIILLK